MKQEFIRGFLNRPVSEGRTQKNFFCGIRVTRDDEASEANGESHEAEGVDGASDASEGDMSGGAGEGEKDSGRSRDCRARAGKGPRETAWKEEESGDDEDGSGKSWRNGWGEKSEDDVR